MYSNLIYLPCLARHIQLQHVDTNAHICLGWPQIPTNLPALLIKPRTVAVYGRAYGFHFASGEIWRFVRFLLTLALKPRRIKESDSIKAKPVAQYIWFWQAFFSFWLSTHKVVGLCLAFTVPSPPTRQQVCDSLRLAPISWPVWHSRPYL